VEVIACFFLLFLLSLVWLAIATFSQYNQLARLRQDIEEARSNIMIVLQKRLDMVRQLAAASYSYAQIEVPAMVSIARSAVDVRSMQSAATQIASAMDRIILLSQQYPELKSTAQFQQLMAEQSKIEEELQHKREEYNAKVKQYNVTRSKFPVSILANMMNLPEIPYWQAEASAAEMRVSGYEAPGIPGGTVGSVAGGFTPSTGYFGTPQVPAQIATSSTTSPSALPSRGSGVHAWLEVIRGATGSPIVTVYDGLIIGRGRGADVQLTDTTVSRRHAIIRVSQGQCFIQDPGSSNGTYVNGRRITAQALRDGDRITIGDAELIFRSK